MRYLASPVIRGKQVLGATIDERIGPPISANSLAFSLAISPVLPHRASAPHQGPAAWLCRRSSIGELARHMIGELTLSHILLRISVPSLMLAKI